MRVPTMMMVALAIAAGPAPPLSSPARAAQAAYRDALFAPEEDAPYLRYLWVPEQGEARKQLRAAWGLHLNLLSREAAIAGLVEVTPDVWRLDARDVAWDLGVLENAARLDPFFHERLAVTQGAFRLVTHWPGGRDRSGRYFRRGTYSEPRKRGDLIDVSARWLPTREITRLRELTYSEVPILHAGWLLAQSARQISPRRKVTGLGYYDFLRLKSRDDYFRLIGFSEKVSLRVQRETRAALEVSGVSPQNRQVVRLQGAAGGVWVTLDTADQSGRGVAIRNLKRGEFVHQAEEWYSHLPNDLPAVYLSNDKGVQQNVAPADALGLGDRSPLNESTDISIHPFVSCAGCHAGRILQPIDDYVRRTHREAVGLGSKKREDVVRARAQYFSDLGGRLSRDVDIYAEAMRLATITPDYPLGLAPQKAVEAYLGAYHGYVTRPVTLTRAALLLGVSEVRWKERLAFQHGVVKKVDPGLTPFVANPPLDLSILTFEDVYPTAQEYAHGFVPR